MQNLGQAATSFMPNWSTGFDRPDIKTVAQAKFALTVFCIGVPLMC